MSIPLSRRTVPLSTKVLKALGDTKRAIIVDMLSYGELCACMILEKFEMSQSTLSHHMKLLCECGLVRARNEGKWTYYSLDVETVCKTHQFFWAITSDKENCICRKDTDCYKECDADER